MGNAWCLLVFRLGSLHRSWKGDPGSSERLYTHGGANATVPRSRGAALSLFAPGLLSPEQAAARSSTLERSAVRAHSNAVYGRFLESSLACAALSRLAGNLRDTASVDADRRQDSS